MRTIPFARAQERRRQCTPDSKGSIITSGFGDDSARSGGYTLGRGRVRDEAGRILRRLKYVSAVSVVVLAGSLWAVEAQAQEARARVEGVQDEALRGQIERAVGESRRSSNSRLETRRRAREAADDAVALLRSEGYYANRVDSSVTEGEPGVAVIRVEPGPRFTFADVQLAYTTTPPLGEADTAARQALDIQAGAPGRAPDVLAAEGRAVVALQQRGYADAEAAPREVVVDHADRTVRPRFRLNPGALVRMDGLDLRTEGRTRRDWVLNLAPWRSGEVYDPEDVAELERRLLDTGVYDAVTVALAPAADAEGLRPVLVSLADRPPNLLEAGVSYSTSEGAGLEGRYSRFNVLGRGETATATLILAQIEQRLALEASFPHFRRAGRVFRLGADVFHEQTDAFDRAGLLIRADMTQRFGRTTFFTYGASAEAVEIEDSRGQRTLFTGTLLGAFNLDRSNDPLDPVRGWRLEARVEPTATFGDDELVYLRSTAQYSLYIPFDEEARTVLAGRVRAGAILNGSIPEVPADRRFFAGGGGSVRGYEYQGIGPRDPDNKPVGGLSLLEGSIEVRRQFTDTIGAAAFIDVGAISESELPTFDDAGTAIGVGVRYRLPFGPIRADIAFPIQNNDDQAAFQIYVSIGQAF